MDDPVDVAAVKAWIRAAREAAGHSQRSLAEATGYSRKTLGSLEKNGEDVSLGQGRMLYAVLRELDLLRIEEAPTTQSDRPVALRDVVDEILERTTLGFEEIGRRLDELERRLPSQDGEDDQQATDEV